MQSGCDSACVRPAPGQPGHRKRI